MTRNPFTPPTYDLPPYLRQTEPQEIEDLPLQVSLLTMEIANLRLLIRRLFLALGESEGEAGADG